LKILIFLFKASYAVGLDFCCAEPRPTPPFLKTSFFPISFVYPSTCDIPSLTRCPAIHYVTSKLRPVWTAHSVGPVYRASRLPGPLIPTRRRTLHIPNGLPRAGSQTRFTAPGPLYFDLVILWKCMPN